MKNIMIILVLALFSLSALAYEDIFESTRVDYRTKLANDALASVSSVVVGERDWDIADYYDDVDDEYTYDFFLVVKIEQGNTICSLRKTCGADKRSLSEATCPENALSVKNALMREEFICKEKIVLFN